MHRLLAVCFLIWFGSNITLADGSVECSAPVWLISYDQGKGDIFQLADVQPDVSNNNLAINIYRGRLYVAFRSAPHHHPKPPLWAPQFRSSRDPMVHSRMFVVSAEWDGGEWNSFANKVTGLDWRLECEISERLAEDVFEPIVDELDSADGVTDAVHAWTDATFGKEVADRMIAALGKKPLPSSGDERRDAIRRRIAPQTFGCDLREPLFFEIDGKLHLYFMQIEGVSMQFRALRAWDMSIDGVDATWSTPTPVLEPGEHFWEAQIHEEGGKEYVYLSSTAAWTYGLSENSAAIRVYLRRSSDGVHWEEENVYTGGGGEPAFAFDPVDHALWMLLRAEMGDERGWGSLLLRKELDDPKAKWQVPKLADPRKYDSARMLLQGNDVYLIARQSVTKDADGKLDERRNAPFDRAYLGVSKEEGEKARAKILDNIRKNKEAGNKGNALAGLLGGDRSSAVGVAAEYSLRYYFDEPKRTAVYRLNRETKEFVLLETLPSAGDTAFPSIERLDADHILVGNYSSDPRRPEWNWKTGQENRTGIYLMLMTFRE